MTLRADGVLEVRAPRWVTERDVQRFILDRIDWVTKQKRHLAERPPMAERQYQSDEVFYLDGDPLRLDIHTGPRRVWVDNEGLRVRLRCPTPDAVKSAVIKFYKNLAFDRFTEALHDLAVDMGETKPLQLVVTNTRGRWGSCTDQGRVIRLSAKLLMAPPLVQDYVMVHELCHLQHMNHSAAFWAKVARFCPNYRAHEKALKHHAGLWQL